MPVLGTNFFQTVWFVSAGSALADDVHDVPAAPVGALVREDAVPGRLHQGGAGHEAGPQRGTRTGTCRQLQLEIQLLVNWRQVSEK